MSGEVKDLQSLYTQYCDAVKSGDMEQVLKIGELYFCALHDGELTEDDRERLQREVLMCAVKREKL